MATTSTVTSTPAATGPPPFARLMRELDDLDYSPADTGDAERPAYTAVDSRVTVTLDSVADPPRARIEGLGADGDARWEITFTSTVPYTTQLIVLYAAINDDPTQALHGAATALDAEPPDPAPHTVAGGG